MTYAPGTKALYECMRCGFVILYTDRIQELSGIFVCSECYDGSYQALNHPQNFPPVNLGPDGILDRPNSDISMASASPSIGTWSILTTTVPWVPVPSSSSTGPG